MWYRRGVHVVTVNEYLAKRDSEWMGKVHRYMGLTVGLIVPGMTGTALTEEEEFATIYRLDVVEIPTNKPVARIDHHDVVYKTEAGKFRAIVDRVMGCHEKGQPVLVGTVSIEKSEVLSKLLKKAGVPHSVLNAKYQKRKPRLLPKPVNSVR